MNDLDRRLRDDAKRFAPSCDEQLAERIVASLPSKPKTKIAPIPAAPLRFPLWIPFAAAACLVIGIALLNQHRDGTETPSTPQSTATTLSLPPLDLPAAWRITSEDPLAGELALLEEDVRSAGRFLAERFPSFSQGDMN